MFFDGNFFFDRPYVTTLYNTFGRCNNFSVILHVVIRNVVYFFVVTSQECIPGHLHFSYKFH